MQRSATVDRQFSPLSNGPNAAQAPLSTGEMIRVLRRQLGLTQRDIAQRAKVNVETIVRIENGGETKIGTLDAVMQAIGMARTQREGSPKQATLRVESEQDRQLLERWALLKPDTRESMWKMIVELTNAALQAKHEKQTA